MSPAPTRSSADSSTDSASDLVELLVEILGLDQQRPIAAAIGGRRFVAALELLAEVVDLGVTGDGLGHVDDLVGVAVVRREQRRAPPHLDAGLAELEAAGVDALGAVAEDHQSVLHGPCRRVR